MKYIQRYYQKFGHTLDKLAFGLLLATLIAVPTFPKFPLIDLPQTSVSIRLEDFLLALLVLIWGISSLSKIPSIIKNKQNILIAVFLFVGLVSLLSAVLITNTVSAPVGFLHWARRLQYLILLPIAYNLVSSKQRLRLIIKSLAVVTIYVFIVGLGQKFLNWPIITTQNAEYSQGLALSYMPGGHMISTFAGHYDLATFLIVTIPLWWLLVLGSARSLKGLEIFTKFVVIEKVIYLGLALCGIWLLTHAASRISIVSYLGAVTISLFFAKRKIFIPIIVAFSLLATGLTSNLVSRYQGLIEVVVDRISVISVVPQAFAQVDSVSTPAPSPIIEDRSFAIRQNVSWPRAINAFLKNPVLGTGYSSLTLATDNGYLRMLGEVGALGTIAFMLLILNIALTLFKNVMRFPTDSFEGLFVIAIFSSLSGVLLNNVFIDIFEASKFAIIYWILIGAAIRVSKKYE